MTMQENCPKDGGNSVLSAPKEKMDKNAEYSRTATSPQISSQIATRFAGNVVAGPFHVLKFQNKLYSVTLVCRYLIHVLTRTKWDLELWKIYKAPFLWLCTVSLSLFCTVRGEIFAFPLEFGVHFLRLYVNWIYLRTASFQAPTRPIWRSIEGVVGDTEGWTLFWVYHRNGFRYAFNSFCIWKHFLRASFWSLDRQKYFARCHERQNLLFWRFNNIFAIISGTRPHTPTG